MRFVRAVSGLHRFLKLTVTRGSILNISHPVQAIHLPKLAILLCITTLFITMVSVALGAPELSQETQTMELEELWRIGGADDEDNLLGVIHEVNQDENGNIYLLDIQLMEVQVFSADGEYINTLGKQGEGPGEIRRATDFVLLPDGVVGLVQGFPGKIVTVDQEGRPAGDFKPGGDDPTGGGFFALRKAASVGNHLVLSGTKIIRGDNSRTATDFIATFNSDGSEGARFMENTNTREFRTQEFSEKAQFFPHEGGWALGADGTVVVAPERNNYLLKVYNASGDLKHTITHPFKSWKRDAADKERAKEMMMPWRRRNRSGMNIVVEPTERDIRNIRIDGSGNIWVLTSRGSHDQAQGIHSTWDVFDTSGKFTRQVSIACDANSQDDTLFFVGDNTVVIVKEHANALFAFQGRGRGEAEEEEDFEDIEPLEVICYRILN